MANIIDENDSNTVHSAESIVSEDQGAFPNFLEKELNSKIGVDGTEDVEKYKQLVYEYYLKSEDLDNKCMMLHRNLQEMKEAWEKTKHLKNLALKEKESMTLKFAKGEKQMLNEKELKEKAEKNCKTLAKEVAILNQKLQMNAEEKKRISLMYDNKIFELKNMKTDYDQIMNQNCILKNELKLCQIALKKQAESHSDSQITIKNLNERIQVISEQKNQLELQSNKVVYLQQELEEIKLDRIEKEQLFNKLSNAFDDLSLKYNSSLNENRGFSNRIQILENNIFEYKNLLEHGAFTLDNFSKPKNHEDENIFSKLKEKLDFLEIKNKELENDVQSCRIRENETLIFSQQLAEKNAKLQSENYNLNNILKEVESQKSNFEKYNNELKEKYSTMSEHFSTEKEIDQREKLKVLVELDALKNVLSQKNTENLMLMQQLLDQKEEIFIVKRKHSCTLRELRKEIKSSRTSHDSSSTTCPSSLSLVSTETDRSYDQVEVVQPENEFNKDVLMARILRLQKTSVRKSEKIDLLEDTIDGLLLELHKKRKLLQSYFLRERTHTLTSNKMDRLKKDRRKFGGIMASLYDGKVYDHNLTLRLSLEINCRLQSVLEDVLLKNIILQDNIGVLGEEIEKLKRQLRK